MPEAGNRRISVAHSIGVPVSTDATAVWGLDDGHHIQIDAVGQAAVESHLVQARLVAAGQAGVVDEAGTRPAA